MFLVIFKFLRTLYPYLKESFFSKQPLPEILYKHRLSFFFMLTTAFFFAMCILFFDAVMTIVAEKNRLTQELALREEKIRVLDSELESTKKNLDPAFYRGIISRLEEEVGRLDKENKRYRDLLTFCESGR